MDKLLIQIGPRLLLRSSLMPQHSITKWSSSCYRQTQSLLIHTPQAITWWQKLRKTFIHEGGFRCFNLQKNGSFSKGVFIFKKWFFFERCFHFQNVKVFWKVFSFSKSGACYRQTRSLLIHAPQAITWRQKLRKAFIHEGGFGGLWWKWLQQVYLPYYDRCSCRRIIDC